MKAKTAEPQRSHRPTRLFGRRALSNIYSTEYIVKEYNLTTPVSATVAQAPPRGRTIAWANHYDLVTRILSLGRVGALREQTMQRAGPQPGERVLDVGCGTGRLTHLARRRVGEAGVVYGIDASPKMIAVARAKAAQEGLAVDFRVGLIEALDFPDQSLDVVLSNVMFHHLPDDLQEQGLAEIFRVLKPGGRLLVVDLQRPMGFIGHVQMTLFAHGALINGVEALPRRMRPLGFEAIEQGRLAVGPIGYVLGRRALTAEHRS
ncbi:MAG: methyltransferase domain-containing protein [Anaerolineales bacterium]|nr:methyltransferase domain-containing protein [Anaerolineales bacterium]